METKRDALKHCPFCGANAIWIGTEDTEWVQCDTCFACTDVYEANSGDAERNWNKRVDLT